MMGEDHTLWSNKISEDVAVMKMCLSHDCAILVSIIDKITPPPQQHFCLS